MKGLIILEFVSAKECLKNKLDKTALTLDLLYDIDSIVVKSSTSFHVRQYPIMKLLNSVGIRKRENIDNMTAGVLLRVKPNEIPELKVSVKGDCYYIREERSRYYVNNVEIWCSKLFKSSDIFLDHLYERCQEYIHDRWKCMFSQELVPAETLVLYQNDYRRGMR